MRRYSKWSSRAKVIGGVGVLALVATSGAFAWVGDPDSTVTVTTDGGGTVHAASFIDNDGTDGDSSDNLSVLSPDSTIPIIIRVHNDTSSAVQLTGIDAGRSPGLGDVTGGVASADYCPEGSITTTAVIPGGGETVLTSNEGHTTIPAGGEWTYSSTATFDVDSFPDVTNPAQDQTGCLSHSHLVPITVHPIPAP